MKKILILLTLLSFVIAAPFAVAQGKGQEGARKSIAVSKSIARR